jgi:hypothetical protein
VTRRPRTGDGTLVVGGRESKDSPRLDILLHIGSELAVHKIDSTTTVADVANA